MNDRDELRRLLSKPYREYAMSADGAGSVQPPVVQHLVAAAFEVLDRLGRLVPEPETRLAERHALLVEAVRDFLGADGSEGRYDASEMIAARKRLWTLIGGCPHGESSKHGCDLCYCGPHDPRVTGLLQIEGSIGQTLIAGTDYRVAEIREHHEPSGMKGLPATITTVIRFDPVRVVGPDSLDAAWKAAEAALRPGVVKAISIGQYPEGYESAGEWTALLVYEPAYYGNGSTPTAALQALTAKLTETAR
jgi:hypothetical protein